ncbi:uncharacterized protein MELLADRAFT_110177 [Melampsora larici-populina 98AG31]|uniref:Uncharacterized protein n=1 Tax=Melampsora larici-populina (strain 98AG31 / pathotype 3-4-7) TaxID=747676 RepID=F4RYX8_MELLP|nr:uncharacterized protein MELLADRAFT_110177 [Melampsora larici-populina 98AG31]EGG02426.1 hypothetical protein MELLADRAFT_110177 [Melampsora larici-populina 98AG31]
MATQDATGSEMFSKDVEQILSEHEKQKDQKEAASRGRGKATKGRARGGRRGRGGASTGRQTRSTAKGKIRTPKDQTSEEENVDEEEENQEEDEKEKERKIPGSDLTEEEENEVMSKEGRSEDEGEEDTISLGDEADFVKEDAHVEREHERYKNKLLKLYAKGKVGKFQMLETAYHKWCEKVKSKPKMIEMLEVSSEEEETELSSSKRKGKSQPSEKPAKVGKMMNHGTTLTHRLIDISSYWDGRMTACFGCVPLTIFVPAWLLADKTHMANRRKQSSSCSDVVSYAGLRVPSEWRQSFLMWSTSFNLYLQYWRTKYHREDIALRLEEHRKIVLALKTKYHDAWAPALRYDITHRTNVFSWDMLSNSDKQITAVTGGRMLSHLAPNGRNQQYHHQAQGTYNEGVNHGLNTTNQHMFNEYQDQGSSSGQGGNGRGRGRRGRGVSRGGNGRGGGQRPTAAPPTTVVNGVVVPKFGPGAFEAVKAVRQAGTNGNGATGQP